MCIHSTDRGSFKKQIVVNHLKCWFCTYFDRIGFSQRNYDFSICLTYNWFAIHALRNTGLT